MKYQSLVQTAVPACEYMNQVEVLAHFLDDVGRQMESQPLAEGATIQMHNAAVAHVNKVMKDAGSFILGLVIDIFIGSTGEEDAVQHCKTAPLLITALEDALRSWLQLYGVSVSFHYK